MAQNFPGEVQSTEAPNVPMILCHFSMNELKSLDALQEGPSIDPETGLREYSKISSIIEIPEVQEAFIKGNAELLEHGKFSSDLESIYKTAKEQALPFRKAPQDEISPAKEIESMGRYGDKYIALIPLNLAMFLIKLRGGYSKNPQTGLLEFFWGALAATALMAANSFFSHKEDKSVYKQQQERERKRLQEIAEWKQHEGHNLRWDNRATPTQWIENPNYTFQGNENYYLDKPQPYKKGGIVKALKSFEKSTGIYGPGNGQDDKIKTTVPAGSYIIDASTTANLGDGSSSAGIKMLEEAAKMIRRKYSPKIIREVTHMVKKKGEQTPVYVANEEFKYDPVTTALAGGGNIKAGAEVFKKMVHEVRRHKASNGLGLPPKARHPMEYMKHSHS